MDEVYVWRSETPAVQALFQPQAVNLQVQVRLYGYGGVIVRYPTAVQTITGSALSAVTF